MRKMSQISQKTPDACGETPTETKTALPAFRINQIYAMCLPMLSKRQKITWVQLHQNDLQMDGAAELDKAFDRFPYLTEKETAALAHRCSLDPDQVKVWFMAQRLRYGISWEYKDILEIQRTYTSNQGKEALRNKMADEAKEDRGEKKKQRKRKGMAGANKMGKKRIKQDDDSVMERSDGVERERHKSVQKERKTKKKANAYKTLSDRERPADRGFVVPLKRPDVLLPTGPTTGTIPATSGFDGELEMDRELHPELKDHTVYVSDVAKLKELLEVNISGVVVGGSSTFTPRQDSQDAPAPPTQVSKNKSKQAQLAMMRKAFCHCQYPKSEDYDHLEVLIGVPRHILVQRFRDMRCYIKKIRPRWMNEELRNRALANIQYRQVLDMLAKAQKGCGLATWKRKLEGSESSGNG